MHSDDDDDDSVRLRVSDIPVVDSFVIFGETEVAATVSFDITWTPVSDVRRLTPGSDDPTDPTNFAAELQFAVATGSFSGSNAEGFSFTATGASSEGIFAEMGHERNGRFLRDDDDKDDDDEDKDDDDKDDDDEDKDDDDKDDDDDDN